MLCKIGDVEIWRILDMHGPFMPPEDLFPNAGPDVRAIIETHVPGGVCPQSGRLILPIQGFLLKTPHHIILVDSCVGNDKSVPGFSDWDKRSDTRFLAGLTAAGIGLNDVDFVLCTHLHTDHVGWNTRLADGRWVPTFPNARYVMPAAEVENQRERATELYRESVLPVIEAGQVAYVEAGQTLGDHVTLVATHGHTPGHVCVLVHSGGREALITGDAMHSAAQCWHPEWHFKYDTDPQMAVASRRRLLESAAEKDCVVLGSHFALPSLGRVKAQKGAFRWEE